MKKILRYICLVGIFIIPFIPLIVANNLYFPFITGKGFYFRIVTEIMVAAWAVLALMDASYRPKKSWIVWGLVIFVAIMAIADIFSMNPYKSFWSNYERMEGWITLIHLLGYFLVVTTVLTRDLWDRFFETWIGTSLVVLVYSMLQTVGLIHINQGGVRTDATFGNSAYLAIFAIFSIFILMLFLVRKNTELNTNKHKYIFYGFNVGFLLFILPMAKSIAASPTDVSKLVLWLIVSFIITNIVLAISAYYEKGIWLYTVLLFAEIVVVYNTQTRGSMLGLIGGLVVAGLLVAILDKNQGWIRKTAIGVVVAAIVIVVAFLAVKNTSFIKNNPTLGRFASISLNDPTTQSRFILWHMAWDGFKENPKTVLIGWGQESFNYVFNKYYDPRLYSQEQWFDRAHNVIFDWLIAGGILGLGSYLFFFGSILWYIWKKDNNTLSISERSVLTGTLVAYFINNLFVFDNIASYILYLSIAGYVYARRTHFVTEGATENTIIPVYENRFIPVVSLVLLVGVFYFVNVPALSANLSLIKAITPVEGVNPLSQFQKTLAINSFGLPEAREQLYAVTGQLESQAAQLQTVDATTTAALQQFMDVVDTETEKQTATTPNDARYFVLAGSLYDLAGQHDKAIPILERAAELSPKKQSILIQLASAYLSSGDTQKAEDTLKQAYELDTSYTEAQILYATGAIYNKDFTTASDVLKNLPIEQVAASDEIMHALYYAGQYEQLITLWKIRVEQNPNDVSNHVSLAASYLLIKDNKDAIAEIQAAIDINPSFKAQGEQYIQQIKAGTIQ